MDLPIGNPQTKDFFDQEQIELIQNTPEEIRDVALEMQQRLDHTWEASPEDEDLQERFWELFGPYCVKSADLRIGAKFLRQNQHLLNRQLF